jgi:small nuclear ribonucleoprotein (snRNP)-like protein
MFKKFVILSLTILVINLSLCPSAFAGTKDEKEARFARRLKAKIAKLGIGKDARVEVKLKDGTKIKGYITEVNDDDFSVMNEKTNSETNIPYPQTKQVKGNNLSTGVKIAIGVAIVFLVFVIIGLAAND